VHAIGARRAPESARAAGVTSFLAGIRYIRSRPAILGAISLDMFAVLLGGAAALLPIYARDILDTGPWGLGLLRSSIAVGGLATAWWLAHHPLRGRAGRKMFAGVAVFGVATIVFGVSRSFALSLVALAVLGSADMVSVVVRQSLVQLQTPDEMRGRVSAVNSLFIGASNQLGDSSPASRRRGSVSCRRWSWAASARSWSSRCGCGSSRRCATSIALSRWRS
jgi:hypothetical protein